MGAENDSKPWKVYLSKKVAKKLGRLPEKVKKATAALARDIERHGPVRGNWANYGKMSDGTHHCHLTKGRTTYVCFWQMHDKKIKIVRLTYVGTHEKAPYPK